MAPHPSPPPSAPRQSSKLYKVKVNRKITIGSVTLSPGPVYTVNDGTYAQLQDACCYVKPIMLK
jgi:hypothetical protein